MISTVVGVSMSIPSDIFSSDYCDDLSDRTEWRAKSNE